MNEKVNQNQTLLVAQLQLSSDGWQGQSQLHAKVWIKMQVVGEGLVCMGLCWDILCMISFAKDGLWSCWCSAFCSGHLRHPVLSFQPEVIAHLKTTHFLLHLSMNKHSEKRPSQATGNICIYLFSISINYILKKQLFHYPLQLELAEAGPVLGNTVISGSVSTDRCICSEEKVPVNWKAYEVDDQTYPDCTNKLWIKLK